VPYWRCVGYDIAIGVPTVNEYVHVAITGKGLTPAIAAIRVDVSQLTNE